MLQKIALFYKIFLSRYLFLWGHELASSFLLFRLHKFFLQMIINFSKRCKLHYFVANVAIRSALLNSSPLDVKRFVKRLMLKGLLLFIITAPPRVERSLNLFYSSSRSICVYIYIYIYIYIYVG